MPRTSPTGDGRPSPSARPPDPAPVETGRPIGRRAFLGVVAAGIAGIAAGPWIGDRLSGLGGGLPGDLGAVLPGGDGWRIYSIATPFPRFDPAAYALSVTGAVERPTRLAWADLTALPAVDQTSDFHCVTGWSVDDVRWRGIRPRTLIELVRPRPEARWVSFISLEEPYVDQLTLEQFLLPDVLVASHMDDAPLTREHGAPLRLVVPRMYGYKSVKWLAGIRFDTDKQTGYWESNGYDADAWVGRSNGY